MSTRALPAEERDVVATVRAFVDERVRPVARELEHAGSYPTEFDVERCFRDVPLMIVGEGTNEIQRQVIAEQPVRCGGLPG